MYFTEYALKQQTEIKKYFPNLWKFYDEYMGNFGFTTNELKECTLDVAIWLSLHDNYGLIFQTNEAYDGRCWWLTEVEY